MDLIIDPKTISIDFKIVDLLVYTIFVKKHNASGAVKVFNDLIKNIVTGPNKSTSFIIIIIGPSKTYRLFNNPFI